ncbi:MAG: hypothetical protein WCK98_00125 [bacterium]
MNSNSDQPLSFLRPTSEPVDVSDSIKLLSDFPHLKSIVLNLSIREKTTVEQFIEVLALETDIYKRISSLNRLLKANELTNEKAFLNRVRVILRQEERLVAALPLSAVLEADTDLKSVLAKFERNNKAYYIDTGEDEDVGEVIKNAHGVYMFGSSENKSLPASLIRRQDESYKKFRLRVVEYYNTLVQEYDLAKNGYSISQIRKIYAVSKIIEKLNLRANQGGEKTSIDNSNDSDGSDLGSQLSDFFDFDKLFDGTAALKTRMGDLSMLVENPSNFASILDPVNLELERDQIGHLECSAVADYWQNLGENFEHFSDDLEVVLESLAMNGRRYSPAQIIDAQSNLNLLQGHISESVVKNIEYELESLKREKKTLEVQSESKKGVEAAPHAQKIADAQSRIVLIDGFLQAARFVKGVIVNALAKVDSILESEDDSNLSSEWKSVLEDFDVWRHEELQNEFGSDELEEEDFEDDKIQAGEEVTEVDEPAAAKDDLATRRKQRRGIPREFYGSTPKPSVLKLPIVIKDRRNNIDQQRMNVLGVESPEYEAYRQEMDEVLASVVEKGDPKLTNLALQLYLKRFNRNERNLAAEVTGSLVRMKAINARLIKGVVCKEIAKFARPKRGTPINDLFEDVYGEAEITGNDLPRRGYPDLFAMALVELDHAQNPLYRDRPSVKKRILANVENTLAKSNFNNLSNIAISDQEKHFYVVLREFNQDQRNELTPEQQKTYQDVEDKLRKAVINNLSKGEKEYLEFLETASNNQTLQVLRNISYVFGLLEGGDKARNQISKALFNGLIAVVESKENLKDDDIDILYSPNLNIPQIVDLIAKYGLNELDIELIDKYLARDAMFIAPAYDKQRPLYITNEGDITSDGTIKDISGIKSFYYEEVFDPETREPLGIVRKNKINKYTTRLAVIPRIGDAGILPVEFEVDNEFKVDSNGKVTASIPRIAKQPKTFFIGVTDIDTGFDSERYYFLNVNKPSKSAGSVGVRSKVTEKSEAVEAGQKVTLPMGKTLYSTEQNPKIPSPKNDLEDKPLRHTNQQQVDTERRQSGGYNVLIIDEDDNRSAAQILEDLRGEAEPVPERKKRERKTPRQEAEQESNNPHQHRLNALKLGTAEDQSPTPPHHDTTLAQFAVEKVSKEQVTNSSDESASSQHSDEQISDQDLFNENLKYFIDTFSTEEEVIKLINIIDKLNVGDDAKKEHVKGQLLQNRVNSDQSKGEVDVFYDTLQAFIYILESYKSYPQSRDVNFALFEGIFNRLSENVLELPDLSQMDPSLLSQFDGVWLDFYDVLEHIEAIPVQESVSEAVDESSVQDNAPDSLTLDNSTTIVTETDSQSTSSAVPRPTNSSGQSYAQDSGAGSSGQSISFVETDRASQFEVQPGLARTPEITWGPEKSIQEIQEIRSRIEKTLRLLFNRTQTKVLADKLELKARNTSKWFEIGVDHENLAKLEAFYTTSIEPFLSDVNSPLRLRDLYVITNSGGYGVYDSSHGKSVPAFYKVFNGKPNRDERLYKLLEASKYFSALFARERSGRLGGDFEEQKQKFHEQLLRFEGGLSFSDFLTLLQIGAVCTFVNLMTCGPIDLAEILNNEPSEADFNLEIDTQNRDEAALEEKDLLSGDQITTNSAEAVPTLTAKERTQLPLDIQTLNSRVLVSIQSYLKAADTISRRAAITSLPHTDANVIRGLRQNPGQNILNYLFVTAVIDSLRILGFNYSFAVGDYIHKKILTSIDKNTQEYVIEIFDCFPFGRNVSKPLAGSLMREQAYIDKINFLIEKASELTQVIINTLQSLQTSNEAASQGQALGDEVDSTDPTTYQVPESAITKLDYSDTKVKLSLQAMRGRLRLGRNSLSRVREYSEQEVAENNAQVIFLSTKVLSEYIDAFRVTDLASALGYTLPIVDNFLAILRGLLINNSEIKDLYQHITRPNASEQLTSNEFNDVNRRFKDSVSHAFDILEQILEYHEAQIQPANREVKTTPEPSPNEKLLAQAFSPEGVVEISSNVRKIIVDYEGEVAIRSQADVVVNKGWSQIHENLRIVPTRIQELSKRLNNFENSKNKDYRDLLFIFDRALSFVAVLNFTDIGKGHQSLQNFRHLLDQKSGITNFYNHYAKNYFGRYKEVSSLFTDPQNAKDLQDLLSCFYPAIKDIVISEPLLQQNQALPQTSKQELAPGNKFEVIDTDAHQKITNYTDQVMVDLRDPLKLQAMPGEAKTLIASHSDQISSLLKMSQNPAFFNVCYPEGQKPTAPSIDSYIDKNMPIGSLETHMSKYFWPESAHFFGSRDGYKISKIQTHFERDPNNYLTVKHRLITAQPSLQIYFRICREIAAINYIIKDFEKEQKRIQEGKISDYVIPKFSLENTTPNLTELVELHPIIVDVKNIAARLTNTGVPLEMEEIRSMGSFFSQFDQLLNQASVSFKGKFDRQISSFKNEAIFQEITNSQEGKTEYVKFLLNCSEIIQKYLQKQADFMCSAEYIGSLGLNMAEVESFFNDITQLWNLSIVEYQKLLANVQNRAHDKCAFVLQGGESINTYVQKQLNLLVNTDLRKFLDAYRAIYSINNQSFNKRYTQQEINFAEYMQKVANNDGSRTPQQSQASISPLVNSSITTSRINLEFFNILLNDIRPKISSQNRFRVQAFLSPNTPNPIPENYKELRQVFDDLRREVFLLQQCLDNPRLGEGVGADQIDPELEIEFGDAVKENKLDKKNSEKLKRIRQFFVITNHRKNINKLFSSILNLARKEDIKMDGFVTNPELLRLRISTEIEPKSKAEKDLLMIEQLKEAKVVSIFKDLRLEFYAKYQKAMIKYQDKPLLEGLYNHFTQTPS